MAEAGCHGDQTGVCAMTTAQKKESVELPVNTGMVSMLRSAVIATHTHSTRVTV